LIVLFSIKIDEKMKIGAVIVAAGKGERFGENIKKQFYPLKGKPIIVWTLNTFDKIDRIGELIIVVEKEDKEFFLKEILNKYQFSKNIRLAEGGNMRQDSVFNGIMSTSEDVNIIVIHDGVRPFVSHEIINNVIDESIREGAAIAAIKENDTTVSSIGGYIESFFDRNSIYRVQTPQAFKRELIIKGLNKAYKNGFYGTDDSSLITRMGKKVKIVEGSSKNIKITSRDDLYIAERILENLRK